MCESAGVYTMEQTRAFGASIDSVINLINQEVLVETFGMLLIDMNKLLKDAVLSSATKKPPNKTEPSYKIFTF